MKRRDFFRGLAAFAAAPLVILGLKPKQDAESVLDDAMKDIHDARLRWADSRSCTFTGNTFYRIVPYGDGGVVEWDNHRIHVNAALDFLNREREIYTDADGEPV